MTEIEKLIEQRDKLNEAIKNYNDGFIYLVKVLSFGSESWYKFTNLHSAKEIENEYNGDNGFTYIYSNNPELYRPRIIEKQYLKNFSTEELLRIEEKNKTLRPYTIEKLEYMYKNRTEISKSMGIGNIITSLHK